MGGKTLVQSSLEDGKTPQITIEDLPSDVLLVISHNLLSVTRKSKPIFPYALSMTEENRRIEQWPSCDSYIVGPPFLESIASVYPRWRDAMSAVSTFWTRLVAWVGRSDPTPLLRVRQYLELSRKLNFEVYILQRP